ncbi:septal ring lytic transglycosylase RlpA family protein [Erythrobacteraceae bacterium E2-1 Yellow Sea]|nr:septal ring lytic transglycosylase RlpA family protein [Erythrobacteraceae bacterium E2-1 Yellow Sea]
MASFYGRRFAGRPTASGEAFDPTQLTAAHRTLPFGSLVRVTNPRNGRSVVVRINDRGPFHGRRVIDLSRAAAEEIGIVQSGHGRVELELLED